MPSSSTRTTHLERHTTALYRAIHTHLTTSDRADVISHLARNFADLLEIDSPTLQLAVQPAFTSRMTAAERQAAFALRAELRRLGAESSDRKQSERLAAAGAGCAEVGDLLRGVGRTREGLRWARWADDIWAMARKAEAVEEAWRQVVGVGMD